MQPLLFDGGRHVLHARGDGARAAAVREGVDLRKARPPREGAGGGKIRFRLAREARDDVRRDGGVGEGGVNLAAGGKVSLAGIAAVHGAQHRVRPALQRKMEVRHEIALFHGGEQFVGDGAHLQRAEAKARGHVLQKMQKPRKIALSVVIVGDVHAREHDLFGGRR